MKPIGIVFLFTCCLCLYLLSFSAKAQQVKTQVENRDIKDLLASKKKSATRDTSTNIEVDKNYIAFLPVVGYAPANGFMIGSAFSFSRLFDPKPTNLSSGLLNFMVTTKQQFIVIGRTKVYLDKNKWFLQGDWRFLLFAQPTYGLGINDIEGSDALISINGLNNVTNSNSSQDMRFNYVRLYEDIVRNIGKNWYVGLGFASDYHFGIVDQRLQLDSSQPDFFVTSHYGYSKTNNFSTTSYNTTGINFNVLTDTRDNVANAYKGYLASVSYRYNPTFLGSSQQSTMLSYDGRYFLPIDKMRPRHLISFWSWGQFVLTGKVPYLALPSIGWDTYNRSGRGYIQGRFRGTSMLYNEVEYRFPLNANGLLGGVAFVNTTFAKSPTQNLFDGYAPGGGIGLRVKMDKKANVNLTVDIAYGRDNNSGIYFNLQEAF
jgi:hypothetical protein